MRAQDTLYVSDLDGTLLGQGSLLSPQSVSMLNRAIADGAKFTIATARTPATVSQLMRDVDLTLPAIVMTGAALWHPKTGEYTRRMCIDPDAAAEMAQIYRECRLPMFVYKLRDKMIDIYHYDRQMNTLEQQFLGERIGNAFKRYVTDDCEVDGMPRDFNDVVLFYSMQPDEMTIPARNRIMRLPGVNPVYYHDMFGSEIALMEVFSDASSKAEATRAVARMAGAKRVVAFGDNMNDIPMLKAADVAVAVGNAIDEVKRVADIVIGSNTEHSVAKFIIDDMQKQL